MNVDDVTQSQKNSGVFHLARKSEFRAGNDITFELTTFQVQVRKSRWPTLLANSSRCGTQRDGLCVITTQQHVYRWKLHCAGSAADPTALRADWPADKQARVQLRSERPSRTEDGGRSALGASERKF